MNNIFSWILWLLIAKSQANIQIITRIKQDKRVKIDYDVKLTRLTLFRIYQNALIRGQSRVEAICHFTKIFWVVPSE